MRRFLIDTDTAADDAVALVMALTNEDVKIEAVTVVAGNVPLYQAVNNALVSVEAAKSDVKVYAGCDSPLIKKAEYCEYVHGKDGLGNSFLKPKTKKLEEKHAVDVIIDYVRSTQDPEIITLGPLTNLAVAFKKAPDIIKKIKHMYVMGGLADGYGNMSPVAEFNFFFDPHAAKIVLTSGAEITTIGCEHSNGDCFVRCDELEKVETLNTDISKFVLTVTKALRNFDILTYKKDGIDIPDAVAVATAFYSDFCRFESLYADIETNDCMSNAQMILCNKPHGRSERTINVCKYVDEKMFKEYFFKTVSKK